MKSRGNSGRMGSTSIATPIQEAGIRAPHPDQAHAPPGEWNRLLVILTPENPAPFLRSGICYMALAFFLRLFSERYALYARCRDCSGVYGRGERRVIVRRSAMTGACRWGLHGRATFRSHFCLFFGSSAHVRARRLKPRQADNENTRRVAATQTCGLSIRVWRRRHPTNSSSDRRNAASELRVGCLT